MTYVRTASELSNVRHAVNMQKRRPGRTFPADFDLRLRFRFRSSLCVSSCVLRRFCAFLRRLSAFLRCLSAFLRRPRSGPGDVASFSCASGERHHKAILGRQENMCDRFSTCCWLCGHEKSSFLSTVCVLCTARISCSLNSAHLTEFSTPRLAEFSTN